MEALLQLLRRQYLYFCTSKASKLSSKHLYKRHGLSRHLFGHLSTGGFVTSDVSSGIKGLVSIGGLVKSAVESEAHLRMWLVLVYEVQRFSLACCG